MPEQRRGGARPLPAYAWAIECTLAALRLRARRYRDLVVAVAVVLIAAAVTAVGRGSWEWLVTGGLLLVPLTSTFFLADERALARWRHRLLERWVVGDLELAALRAALEKHPRLPEATLAAMLALLPSGGDVAAEQRIRAATRHAAAAAIDAAHGQRADALLLNVLAGAVVVAALLAALWLRAWTPLLALALLVLRPAAGAGRRRAQQAAVELAACRREPGFSEADFERLVASVRERP